MADPTQRDGDEEPKVTENVDDIDREETGEPDEIRSKYDPALIRVDPRTFSLHQILDMLDADELDLTPDFQRKKVWKPWQKSRLIESIFLRIPLPAFYFAADGDGMIHVVDGLQRLSTIYDFVKGSPDFSTLSGLEYLTEEQLGGFTWETLGGNWKRRLHSTQIFAHVIDPQTPFPVKFQIFQRLNQGGEPLTAHEIRNSISRKRSRDFLRELANSPEFLEATGYAFQNHPRMADCEAVLRFCAFRMESALAPYESFDSLDDFLSAACRRLDNEKKCPAEQLERLRRDFYRSMTNASGLFERLAFRKWTPDSNRRSGINKPLLESWGCVLADFTWEQLVPHREAILRDLGIALRDQLDYTSAISYGTTSSNKVRLRMQVARDILQRNLS